MINRVIDCLSQKEFAGAAISKQIILSWKTLFCCKLTAENNYCLGYAFFCFEKKHEKKLIKNSFIVLIAELKLLSIKSIVMKSLRKKSYLSNKFRVRMRILMKINY